MAKLALLALACVALIASVEALKRSELKQWIAYKREHGKSYASIEEDSMRREIFLKNKVAIEKFNAEESEQVGYRQGLNHMSDWTEAELDTFLGGSAAREQVAGDVENSPADQAFLDAILNDDSDVPDAVDWRNVTGRVSSVKDKTTKGGACTSDWAYAAVGVLEGQEVVQGKTSGDAISLSLQNLIDCDPVNDGCDQGNTYNALKFVPEQGGIDDEASYPFEGVTGECRFTSDKVVIGNKGAALLKYGDEENLKKVVAKYGPVGVAIATTPNMWSYKGGLFYDKTCYIMTVVNSNVLVVGYGTDKQYGEYWIVKFNVGTKWGENGYMKWARNKKNMCHIASRPVIATF